MTGSETNTGTVAGASTVAAGTAAVAADGGNTGISLFGWIAIIIGALILLSSLILFALKKRKSQK